MLYKLCERFAASLDRVIEQNNKGNQLYFTFHRDWATAHLGAWRDADGSFIVECWRFELVVSACKPRAAQG